MKNMKIPLARPDITNLERRAVWEVLKTPYLALGPKMEEFEDRIAKYVGMKYALAVNSGTAALHLIVKSLDISRGDEVITTPFSFIASSNCILYEGTKPVFVDIKSDTLDINPELIERSITSQTQAILAVDIFGHPADWDKISKIAKKYNLYLIEDSAESFGSEYKGRKCGTFGEAAVFSFYPNKQITTGEGGVVITNNKKIADICESLRNQGRGPMKNKGDWLRHPRLGYNYRISDINCALGLAQLSRIKEILTKREKVADLYNQKLKSIPEIEIPYVAPNVKMSWFVYVIRLSEKYSQQDRDKIIEKMAKKGIQCGTYFQPIHLQPFYRKLYSYKSGDFPICESVAQRTIVLPFHNNLKEREINYVVKNLRGIISRLSENNS